MIFPSFSASTPSEIPLGLAHNDGFRCVVHMRARIRLPLGLRARNALLISHDLSTVEKCEDRESYPTFPRTPSHEESIEYALKTIVQLLSSRQVVSLYDKFQRLDYIVYIHYSRLLFPLQVPLQANEVMKNELAQDHGAKTIAASS